MTSGQVAGDSEGAPGPARETAPAEGAPAPARPPISLSAPPGVDDGAGVVLGLLFWCWVALPYLRGGMPELRRVLAAKFLNKGPDGSWLP